MKLFPKFSIILLSLVLAGCSIGPVYKKPEVEIPHQFHHDTTKSVETENHLETDQIFWWKNFNDPLLTELINISLTDNNDLKIFLTRIEADTAFLRESERDIFPRFTMGGALGHQHLSKNQAFGFRQSADVYRGSVNASWEIDVYSRVRKSIEAQQNQVHALKADLAALQISIVARIAESYLHLRSMQDKHSTTRKAIEVQARVLDLINKRFQMGRGDQLDVTRAQTQLANFKARLPQIESQIAIDEHRIAVLSGMNPNKLISKLEPISVYPTIPKSILPGSPGDLLRRRPDIAAAEYRLQSSISRVGIATSELYPRFTLSGLVGVYSFQTNNLFSSEGETRNIFLGIDWSFLDRDRIKAKIESANAQSAGLLIDYKRTVQNALEETENSLVAYTKSQEERAFNQVAVDNSSLSAAIARKQFEVGAIGYYEVLQAEQSELDAKTALIESRHRHAIAAISIFKSVCGGWLNVSPNKGVSEVY